MIMMPYCKSKPKNYDECDLEGRIPCSLKLFKVNFISGFYSLYTVFSGELHIPNGTKRSAKPRF